ncbi:hypothetical protein FC093_21900 [Ilyomonas limi]|uniref:DUF3945 domain-containing protein n=1 Tax=Ilyomonas limi TaxID=2575867 RepID=A0A4U3KT83_9BACT|nr:hypothetical protein [Ilyomonas limi]TKK64704.1 hypothetical protein FC093_21900 [Ilyomonas limi]
MKAIPISDAIASALKRGNWLAYNQLATVQDKEFYFFQLKADAREFCYNNGSDRDRWDFTYIKTPDKFLNLAKANPQFINHQFIKIYKMNEQNVNYLKEQVKYMGFGEKLHAELEQKIAEGNPEFQLLFQTIVNQKPFEAVLNFRKSDNNDMYFFNSYTAKLEKGQGQSREQTFYINKGKGVTAKEAFNLLDGRAVFKELTNKEEQSYNAWLQLDFKNKDKHGNYMVKQYHENYGYDLAKSLNNLPVKELQTDTQRMELVKSLEKGNLQAVTLENGGKQQRIFIEANPQYKTINLCDGQMNRLKKEEIIQNQAKAPAQTNAKPQLENTEKLNGKEVHTDKGVKTKAQKEKVNKQVKEDSLLPKKRTGRKKGLTQ